MALAQPFTPTHVVPAHGMRAWSEPDGTGPVAARLDPGLDVQVIERKDDWAQIACANGWSAWVDGRHLVDWTPLPEPSATRDGIELRGLSIVSLLGGLAIAGGTFLDWWSIGGFGIDAWDIPVKYLFTGKGGDGFKLGPVLIVLALVLVVGVVIGRRLPSIVLLVVAALAMGLAGAALIRGLRSDPSLNPDVGLILTMAGGLLVASDGFGFWVPRR